MQGGIQNPVSSDLQVRFAPKALLKPALPLKKGICRFFIAILKKLYTHRIITSEKDIFEIHSSPESTKYCKGKVLIMFALICPITMQKEYLSSYSFLHN